VSIYGYLNCHDCRQTLWLGKALHHNYRPFAFHIGSEEEPPHWARPQLNQVLWKFLAEHTGHRIDVRLEHQQTATRTSEATATETSAWGRTWPVGRASS
jgi:hypothetical protein